MMIWNIFELYTIAVFSFLLLHFFWSRRHFYVLSWQLPGPFWLPVLGNLQTFFSYGFYKTLPALDYIRNKYGKQNRLVRLWIGFDFCVLCIDATVGAQINAMCLDKPDFYDHFVDPFGPNGLIATRDIAHWKSSRKIIAQVFHFKLLREYIPIFYDESLILAQNFKKYARLGKSVYVPDDMEVATYNSIIRTSLGFHPKSQDTESVIKTFHRLFDYFMHKIVLPIARNHFFYSLVGLRQKQKRDIKFMETFIGDILEELKSKLNSQTEDYESQSKALAELLMEHPEISKEELIAQIFTVIGAGMDTSSSINSAVLLTLALYPSVQNKVYEEILKVMGNDPNKCPSYEELMTLEYTDKVLKECLRLFPPGPGIARKIAKDLKTTVDGKEFILPKGTTAFISIYSIQRSSYYYKNPNEFDPERWCNEEVIKRNPNCYMPFSTGPRNCIGGKYALLQMKTFLATILRKFELLPSETCKSIDEAELLMKATLELGHNCQIRFREREKTNF